MVRLTEGAFTLVSKKDLAGKRIRSLCIGQDGSAWMERTGGVTRYQ